MWYEFSCPSAEIILNNDKSISLQLRHDKERDVEQWADAPVFDADGVVWTVSAARSLCFLGEWAGEPKSFVAPTSDASGHKLGSYDFQWLKLG